MTRKDLRRNDEIRPIKITPHYTKHAEGSALIEIGDTKVICTASVEDSVPPFLKGTGTGWVSAEYSMLPRATNTRSKRDISKLKLSPRSTEIQRLIARSLRACVDLDALGEISIIVDCDVIQADGGTRCASITGGFIALYLALEKLRNDKIVSSIPMKSYVSAISAGIVDDEIMLDLNYDEDSSAMVDLNIIMDSNGEICEIQGTGEKRAFTAKELTTMLSIGKRGCNKLIRAQKKIVGVL